MHKATPLIRAIMMRNVFPCKMCLLLCVKTQGAAKPIPLLRAGGCQGGGANPQTPRAP